MALYCEKCGQERDYTVVEERACYTVKGEAIEIDLKKAICNFCGEELFHFDIERENQTKAFNIYRDRFGLLRPEEIREIREKYGLSAQEFSLVLGFSPNSITRFERGSIQTKEQDERIRESKSYNKMWKLLQQNGELLHEETKNRIVKMIHRWKLLRMERETVIQFDESTNIAIVITASWPVARSLKKAGYLPVRKWQGKWYFKIPVNRSLSHSDLTQEEQEIVNSVYEAIAHH